MRPGAFTLQALLLLLLLPPVASQALAAGPLLVTGFAVDLPGPEADDAVRITNVGPDAVALAGWTLADGEGTLRWPDAAMIPAGASILVAGNATAWREAGGGPSDYSVLPDDATPTLLEEGPFRLARDGDEIRLEHDGVLVDLVVYDRGDVGEGWAGDTVDLVGSPFLRWYARNGAERGYQDTDTAADWDEPKRRYVGASEHATRSFDAEGGLIAYVAPDESRAVVRATIATANRSLRLNVYELLDTQIAEDLAAKAAGGVDVRVLLDERPVGMEPWEVRVRDGLVATLLDAGAHVHLAAHQRLAFNHAKYLVADGARTLIQTENLVSSGVPVDVDHGNRGWGVVVDDPAFAGYMAGVFDDDFAAVPFGARAWAPSEAGPQAPPLQPTRPAGTVDHPARHLTGAATVRPVLSPDHTAEPDDPLVAALRNATHEVRLVQLNLPPDWRDPAGATWPNPYLEALAEAADRGVRVRLLLDGHFVEGERDNEDTVAWVRQHGADGFEARLWGPDRFGVLHAKGFVVDDAVFLGSMNGNLNSVARNREVGVLIRSPEAAAYYADVFDADWAVAGTIAFDVPAPHLLLAIGTVITAARLIAASASRGRR